MAVKMFAELKLWEEQGILASAWPYKFTPLPAASPGLTGHPRWPVRTHLSMTVMTSIQLVFTEHLLFFRMPSLSLRQSFPQPCDWCGGGGWRPPLSGGRKSCCLIGKQRSYEFPATQSPSPQTRHLLGKLRASSRPWREGTTLTQRTCPELWLH